MIGRVMAKFGSDVSAMLGLGAAAFVTQLMAMVPVLIVAILSGAMLGAATGALVPGGAMAAGDLPDLAGVATGMIVGGLVAFVLLMAVGIFVLAGMAGGIQEFRAGGDVGFGSFYRSAMRLFVPTLGVQVRSFGVMVLALIVLAIVGMMSPVLALIVGVPVIFLAMLYGNLYPTLLVAAGQMTAGEAFGASFAALRESPGRALMTLLAMLGIYLVAMLVSLPVLIPVLGALWGVVLQVVYTPFLFLYLAERWEADHGTGAYPAA